MSLAVTISLLDVSLYKNNEFVASDTMTQYFIDSPTFDHILGNGFVGYVYQVCFSTYARDTFDLTTEAG
jgi:hypothetical protein